MVVVNLCCWRNQWSQAVLLSSLSFWSWFTALNFTYDPGPPEWWRRAERMCLCFVLLWPKIFGPLCHAPPCRWILCGSESSSHSWDVQMSLYAHLAKEISSKKYKENFVALASMIFSCFTDAKCPVLILKFYSLRNESTCGLGEGFLVVARRTHGAHLLHRRLRIGRVGCRTEILVVHAQPRQLPHHLRHLVAGWSKGQHSIHIVSRSLALASIVT